MYVILTKKRAFFITLILIAIIGLATAFALLTPMFGKKADDTIAGVDSDNKREPVFTYVIGYPYLENNSDYRYDKETQTYYYASHIKGWHEAISKSESLGGNVSTIRPDENLVQITLASDWVAQELDDYMLTAFGSGLGFDFARGLLDPGSTNIILDLNGYKIDRNLTNKSKINDGYVIKLEGTTFEVTDNNKEGKLGVITGGNCAGNAGCIMVAENAKLIVSNGRIFNNNANAGGAVFVDGGKVVINGGIIEGNTANDGGGIYVMNSNGAEMNGGVIDNNIVTGDGGGIYLSSGEFIMNGGVISHNQAGISNHGGGGLYVFAGTLTVNGGEIVLNRAMLGGAIRLNVDGTCNIVDCVITGNEAETSGGAIYTIGNLNLQGGLFTGNNCKNTDLEGSGAIELSKSRTISMSGNVQIYGNFKFGTLNEETKLYEKGSRGVVNNCYIKDRIQSKINVGELADTAIIHMYLPKTLDKEITIGYGENNVGEDGFIINPTKYFICDSTNEIVLNSDGELELTNKGSLEWTVVCRDRTEKLTDYGYSLEYLSDNIQGLSLKQGDKQITNITIKDSEGKVINVSDDAPLKNVGKYYVTAKINGIDNKNEVETLFLIIITPYDFTKMEYFYEITTTGWDGAKPNYELKYDGNSKQKPDIVVTVEGQPFMSCKAAYFCNGKEVDELKEVGTYQIKMLGNGNYTGGFFVDEEFVITQNTDITYRVSWQYYNDTEWIELPDEGSAFTYTSIDYKSRVRVVLTTDTETRYVYAEGVTDYNLASGEDENNITKFVVLKINDGNYIIDAGDYNIALQGLTNYRVEQSDSNFNINMAQYDLAQIDNAEGSVDSADVNVYLDKVLYNGKPKKLELVIELTINGNKIMLGTNGAEYDYNVKYIKDGVEEDTDAFIIGGDYKIYIYAIGNNFTGTLGVIGEVTIQQIENNIDLSGIGNWEYGTYDKRIHSIDCQAMFLYDGVMTGPYVEYIYYTIRNEDGNSINDELTRFTELSNEVIKSLNALDVGKYTIVAEVEETTSYTMARASREFSVIQAINSWITAPEIISWSWKNYDDSFDHLVVSAKYGNNLIYKSILDKNGNAIEGLSNFNQVTSEIVEQLRALKAGDYKIQLNVAETNNYCGIEDTIDFAIAKAENVWIENPHLKRWIHGKYNKSETYVTGKAKYGAMKFFVTDIYGTELTDLESLPAGEYVITIMVEGTADYEGLMFTEKFNVFENANMTDKIIAIAVLSALVLGLLTTILVLLIKNKNKNKYDDQY